jgi:hypothetical protein
MFLLYESYQTQEGKTVMIVDESQVGTQYHCVKGNDGPWRYARQSDAGRCTASAFDMSCPQNLVVPDEYAVIKSPEDPLEKCTFFEVKPAVDGLVPVVMSLDGEDFTVYGVEGKMTITDEELAEEQAEAADEMAEAKRQQESKNEL